MSSATCITGSDAHINVSAISRSTGEHRTKHGPTGRQTGRQGSRLSPTLGVSAVSAADQRFDGAVELHAVGGEGFGGR